MFRNCRSLKQLVISPHVRAIGVEAFASAGLVEVNLEHMTTLGEACFAESALEKVVFGGQLLVLPQRAFANTRLQAVALVATQRIGIRCFEGSRLTQIAFGCSVVEIGDGAFVGSGLTEVQVTDSVNVLRTSIFEECAQLNRAVLPQNTAHIPPRTFQGCRGLAQFPFPPHVTSIGASAFSGCTWLFDAGLSESVGMIEDEAFRDCSSLAHLRLPDALVKIGTRAFQGCTGLQVIELGSGVTSWGWCVFSGCVQTTKTLALRGPAQCENWSAQLIPALDASCAITRDGSPIEPMGQLSADGNLVLENLGDVRWYSLWGHRTEAQAVFVIGSTRLIGATFCMARSIRSISLDGRDAAEKAVGREVPMEELGTEGEFGFATECTTLTTLTLPPRLRAIGARACAGCSALSDVDLREPLTQLGRWCFSRCGVLSEISIPSGVTAIPEGAFHSSGVTQVTLPDTVGSVGERAFASSKLTEVTLPDGVTALGGSAFDCTGLTTLSIGSQVRNWGSTVFGKSKRIRRLDLRGDDACPNWPPQIEGVLTDDCEITFNGGPACPFSGSELALSGPVRWFNAHSARKLATRITFDRGVTLAPSVLVGFTEVEDIDMTHSDWAELPRDGGVGLFRGWARLQRCTLSSQLRTVGSDSFREYSMLREVTMPDGVERIGSCAFYQTGLERLDLPRSVRVIETWAFGFAKLREIAIPEGVERIASSAFYRTALEDVQLPRSLRVIAARAFQGTKLREIDLPDLVGVGPDAFDCALTKVSLGGVDGRQWRARCFGRVRRITVVYRGRDSRLIPSPLKDVAVEFLDEDGRTLDELLVEVTDENGTTRVGEKLT
jgi:hypothetical protein